MLLDTLNFIIRLVIFLAGLIIVLGTLTSAIRTFVMPRSARDSITAAVFRLVRQIFDLRLRHVVTYEQRDRVMALYAPIALLTLSFVILLFFVVGYGLMFFALDPVSLERAFIVSGSSLLTLGFETERDFLRIAIEFSEAAIGLLMVALLMAYLPTMYAAFQRREAVVSLLEVRAGSPPVAWEFLLRAYRIDGLDRLSPFWQQWESWFVDLEESHTSLAPLTFFRSPKPDRSWVTTSGAILDAAAIYVSSVDAPRDAYAELCIRAGYLALRSIADFFEIPYDPDPGPDSTISISQFEFYEVYDQLVEEGLPIKANREQCWQDFAGWRVNYDTVLLRLSALTMAPYAPWSSDRSQPGEINRAVRKSLFSKA